MAEIVKARDTSEASEPLVAIKRILPHLLDDQQYKAMFLDESRVLAQLDHASIIPAYEVGEIDGTPYIALEYVDGQDARNLFHELQQKGQRVPLGIACYVAARVSEGLHYAHEQKDVNGHPLGIVHRDVSLQNILISYDGDVKLTDFGIAVSAGNMARTDVGVVKGKFGYMSPEQVKGAVLDRRSDVFSVGICLYELLTGERLFSGESDYKAVERVRNADVPPPSAKNRQIPSSLERIVMKALAKQPRDRFQTANDLRRALQAFLAETNEFVSREDMGHFLREVFPAAYAASLREAAGEAPVPGDEAGLAAFDDIQPPRSVSIGSEGRPIPSVPPLIPRADSIPVGQMPASAARPPIEGDWEEEPTTISPGVMELMGAAAARDDEPTRQLRPTDLDPSLGGPSPRSPVPPTAADSQGHQPRSLPTLEIGTGRPAVSPAMMMSVFGLIALGMIVYMVLDHGSANVKIETDPVDARVRVDGKLVEAQQSPYLLSSLESGVSHTIVVEKPGYTSWSTKLRTRAGKLLVLPLIRLEPLPSDETEAADAQLSAAAEPEPNAQSAPPAPQANDHAGARAKRSASTEAPAGPANDSAGGASDSAAPALRGGGSDNSAPALRGGGSDNSAPALRGGGSDNSTPALRGGGSDNSTPALRGGGSDNSTPALRGGVAHEPAAAKPRAASEQAAAAPAAPAISGTLRINTRPWSQISIDGKAIGNTPQMNLKLKPGSHTVTVKNPDFGVTKTFTVDIKADETVTRVLTLTN